MPKSEETRRRILAAALELFRSDGFESTTMRAIADKAGVATGAAYYYYESKEAIVKSFYEESAASMQDRLSAAARHPDGLEARLRELVLTKIEVFADNRSVLRALLRNGADPDYPLSPFSPQTREIRDADIAWFARAIEPDCGFKVPKDLAPLLPPVLWMYQMGMIFFWVIDKSPNQQRTRLLVERGANAVAALVRLSSMALMRPLRKVVVELIETAWRADAPV